MSNSLIPSFLMSNVRESLRSLTKMSDHERFSQKLGTLRESLRSLTKNEQIARFLCEALIRSFFAKNEQFAQKTDERMPSPAKMLSEIFEINCFSPIFGGSVTKKFTRFFFMIQPHVNHYYEEIQGFNKYFSTAINSTRVRFVVCEASVAWFCFLG